MNREHLVRMANQIGTFFASMPDKPEAMENLATHLKRFWEPRMLKEFQAVLAEGGEGVHPLVIEALEKHRALMAA